jgi:signal transduction histidine kinase
MGKPMNPDKVTRITDEVGRLLDLQTEMIKPVRDDGSNLGIGLACLKERVRKLGGRVDIDSDTGGTKIIGIIPLPTATEAAS